MTTPTAFAPAVFEGAHDLDSNDAAYFDHPAINVSSLKMILRSPAHYLADKQNPRKSTPAMQLGTAIHCAILEPERFAKTYVQSPDCDKRTKAGKEIWEALEQSGKQPIKQDDWQTIDGIRASLHNSRANYYLQNGEAEKTVLTKIHDIDAKAKIDYCWQSGACFDLKTTDDACPRAFERTIEKYKYHMQAAWYLDCLNAAGHDFDRFIFIAIEKEPPYAIGIYELDDYAIQSGRELCLQALNIYRECLESDSWQAYEQGIVKVSLPRWA